MRRYAIMILLLWPLSGWAATLAWDHPDGDPPTSYQVFACQTPACSPGQRTLLGVVTYPTTSFTVSPPAGARQWYGVLSYRTGDGESDVVTSLWRPSRLDVFRLQGSARIRP